MRATSRTLPLAGAILLAALFAAAPSLTAAVITVTGACTLADAIDSANTDSAVGACTAGAGLDDVILTDDVTLLDRLPDVVTQIRIQGNGFTVARDPGEEAFRIFTATGPAAELDLDSVTVTGGLDDHGGGLLVTDAAEMAMFNTTVSGNETVLGHGGGIAAVFGGYFVSFYSTVSDNSTHGLGGGVAVAYGSTTGMLGTEVSGNDAGAGGGVGSGFDSLALLIASTVSGNVANSRGGGVFSIATNSDNNGLGVLYSSIRDNEASGSGGGAAAFVGQLFVAYSEIAGNTAFIYGGGVDNFYSAVTLQNVTVSGNSTSGSGGGLYHYPPDPSPYPGVATSLVNTTFSGNSATAGGALHDAAGEVAATGSVFANSVGGNCFGSAPIDNGGNLADDDTCGTIPDTLTGLDPVLAVNGSLFSAPPGQDPPRTHALLAGSSAIDAAGACGLPRDQRGFPRDDGFCDSGAYERQAAQDADDDGVPDDVDVCPDTVIPEGVPTSPKGLGTNRWALVDDDFVFDTNLPNGNGPGRSYTTTDTAGCSCEQIIDELGLGNGHTKFGCSIGAMDDWVALVGGP